MPRTEVAHLQNNLVYSADYTQANWTKQANVVVTANQAANPLTQAVDADLIDFSASAAGQGFFQVKTVNGAFPLQFGRWNTKSIWLKGVQGGEIVTLADPSATNATTTCNLTTSWRRFKLSERVQSAASGAGLWIRKSSGNQFYAWGAQLVLANWEGADTPTTTSYIQPMIRDIALTSRNSAVGRAEAINRTAVS